MIRLLFLFLLSIHAFASQVTDFNIFEREGRVDVMLSFDSPYGGSISKQSGDGYVNILLSDLYLKEDAEEVFSGEIIQVLKIYQDGANVNILVLSKGDVNVIASKSAEGYGLRLRFSAKGGSLLRSTTDQGSAKTPLSDLTKEDNIDYKNYLLVFGVLLFLIGILYVVKKKVAQGATLSSPLQLKSSWLFSGKEYKKEDIKLINQKFIDPKTRVCIIEIYKRRYAVLITPNSATFIDKIDTEESETKSENDSKFEAMLNDNKERLKEYLSIEDKRFEELKRQAGRDTNLFDQLR